MSDHYYRRLSYVDGRGGSAIEGDLRLKLHAPPIIFPHAVEIEFGEVERDILAYDPYIRDGEGMPKRDMTAPEIIAVRRWLHGLMDCVQRVAAIAIPLIADRRKLPR